MKDNNNNDTWIDLFLFFLVADKAETVTDLIRSDNCEEKFTDIVQRIATMDSECFQCACIDWLTKHREKLMELNKTYKTSQKGSEKRMTKETIIKSALKYLVKMQIEEGSVGFAVDNDPDHDCCWDELLAWLEAQPCEDCISRETVKQIGMNQYETDDYGRGFGDAICEVLDLPSVTPRTNLAETSQGWIPVSERLPEEHECIKNNGLFNVSEGNRSYFGWFDYDTKKFVKPTIAGFCVDNAVIAWMPLPEPCKAESDKEVNADGK